MARTKTDDSVGQITVLERYRDPFWQHSQDLLGVADENGVWVSISPSWSRVLGWPPDEIVGRTSEWMEHPDDRKKTRLEIRALAAGRTTFEFENRFRTKAGAYLTLSWTAVPEDALLYCVARDVTEPRAASAAAAERAAAQERTWNYTPDLLSIIDMRSGAFERVNPAWTTALGWRSGEIEGKPFGEFLHPDDVGASKAAFEKVRLGDPVLRFENRYRTRDGAWRWLSWVAFPEGDKLYSSCRDITEDKQRAIALRLYENIVQSDAAPVCAFDTDYRLIAFNEAHRKAFRRVYGIDQQVGDSPIEQFVPEQAEIVKGFMTRALAGESFIVREEFGDPGLERPYWETAYNPLRDADGNIVGGFHHAVDITGELRTAAELGSAEEQLRQSQKMEAVGQLTGGLAHDFNNLLAGISGSLELMQIRMQQGRVSDVERYMGVAQGATRRAAALTHRLLAFSRRQTLAPQPTEVNRLVSGMQDMIQRSVGPSIAIEVVGASSLWPALVDSSQLENALLNLCINARDAMPTGGRITIETANRRFGERDAQMQDVPQGQYLSLSVTDTGAGMPPEVIARVFEPFYTTKPIGEGTGLGLSMIYGFAQQSGGQVRIYSEVGKGTTVTIYLPRHHGLVAAEGSEAKRDVLRSEKSASVLVVDDEPTVRMLVLDILQEFGYAAMEAADSATGLKILQSDAPIDLLVTDVGLPGGLNGRQMADAGRVTRPDLKVLFITGFAENAVLGQGQLGRGMAVMTKPFAVAEMADRIRAMIEVDERAADA